MSIPPEDALRDDALPSPIFAGAGRRVEDDMPPGDEESRRAQLATAEPGTRPSAGSAPKPTAEAPGVTGGDVSPSPGSRSCAPAFLAASTWVIRLGERVSRWLRVNSFTSAWLPASLRRPGIGYLVAALAQLVAVTITTSLDRAFTDFNSPDLLAALVIVTIALTFGAGPSLLATVIALPLIDYFLMRPMDAFTLAGPGSVIGLLLLLAVGITISVVASRVETQRRRAGQLAVEREAVLQAVPDGMLVYDERHRLVQVNPAGSRMLGLEGHEDYLRHGAAERGAHVRFRSISGAPIPLDEWPINRVLHGETLRGPSSVDARLESLIGGAETLVNISGAPVRDREGRLIGATIVMHDVSEQRRLERRTHEALAALLQMAEVLVSTEEGEVLAESYAAAPVAKRLAELTASVLGCRRVAITVVDAETEVGRPVAVAGLAPEDEQRWWSEQAGGSSLRDSPDQALVARLRAGEVITLDLSQPPYNASPNPWRVRDALIAPMRMGERLVGLLTLDHGGVAHHYTMEEQMLAGAVAKLVGLVVERERLFQQREEARAHALALHNTNQRMNEFLGVASHELKTPMTSLKVNVQLGARWLARLSRRAAEVNERFAGEVEPVRELLERSDRTMARLTRLVDDLLDVSRIRAGQLELRREPSDLVTIVRDVVAEERAVVAEEGSPRAITLELGEVASIPLVADADRIGQVVTNYLTNALKYSPADAPVEVRLEALAGPMGGTARVSVRDFGPGLPAEEREQIWEPFHRAQGIDVQSGSGVGLGLGLYISRTIIERHGGVVGVASAAGEGATFWFELPLAPGGV